MGNVVAQKRGDAQLAVQRAEAAQRVLKESRFDSALMDLRSSFGGLCLVRPEPLAAAGSAQEDRSERMLR